MSSGWFNTKVQRDELRELREVADRVRRMVNRIYPGAGNSCSPITAVATLEVWLTDTLFEKERPK
jgi:hypothetical protein